MHTTSDIYQRLAIDVIRQDGGTQPRAAIQDEWINDYAEDMRAGAAFPAIDVFFDGSDYWLADGFHRIGAALAASRTEIEAKIHQGTRRDAVLFSVGANGQHGHRRTNDDKRRAVDVLLNDPEWSKWSDREIARQCGVTHPFVSQRRAQQALSGNHCQMDKPRLVTRNGISYVMQTDGIGQRAVVGFSGGSGLNDDSDAPSIQHHLTRCTGENEWYTPGRYIEAARAVLGCIDLDPASSAIANQTVQAKRFYTIEDDGLTQPWYGNLWMNPPYSQPAIAQFMAKLVAEVRQGTVAQAVCLVNNSSDTSWFQSTFAAADAACFARGRITFVRPDGTSGASPLQGQAFFYFGPNVDAFTETFRSIGTVSTKAAVGFGDIDAGDAEDATATDVAMPDEPIARGRAEILKAANRIKAEESKARNDERVLAIAKAAEGVPAVSERYTLTHGSLMDLLNEPAASVDFIITDPPYPKEFLPVFGQLGEVAKHLLKPGGLLLCMSGQTYLPEVHAQLGQHLDYHWTTAYLTPGGQATQVFPRRVNTFWKPVIVYSKGTYTGDWFGDVTRSDVNDNDKEHHHWGQSESGMLDLMRRFVRPGHIVVDPFLGGGTTAIAALELGCTFIGCDIDEQAINATKARLADAELAA